MCSYLPLLQKLPAALVIRKVKVTKHSSRVSLREIFTWKGLKRLTEPLRNISGWVFSFKGLLLLRTTLCAFSSFGKGKITAHNVGTKIGLIGHIYFGIFCTGGIKWWWRYKNSTYYFDFKLQFYLLFLSQKWFTHTFLSANTITAGFLLQKWFEHTCFVAKMIYTHFLCYKNYLCTFFVTKRICAHFFLLQKRFRCFFVAKTIYAHRPESFCALKVAIRKVQTFWASG